MNKIVNTALSFKGKLKYVFGGNNIPGGYGDCSDFTQYVYDVNGKNIGADTEAQYTSSTVIPTEAAQPGDLIFFKNTYNSGKTDGVSHVGIITDYDGNFIQLGENGCTVENISEPYWSSHFLSVNRVDGVKFDETPKTDTTENVSPVTQNTEKNNLLSVALIILAAVIGLTVIIPMTIKGGE